MQSARSMTFPASTRWLVLMLWLPFATCAVAQGSGIVIEQTVSPTIPVFVEPGGSAGFSLSVRNDGADTVPLATFRAFAPVLPRPPIWTFDASASPRCSAMRLVYAEIIWPAEWPAWEFDVHDLAPGERVECAYTLSRDETATYDIPLNFGVVVPADDPGLTGNHVAMVAGSLTHVEFSIREACDIPATATSRTARVSLTNHGPTSLDGVGFGFCLDNFFPGFSIDGNIPDGCGPNLGAPGLCFSGGIGWAVSPMPAGESATCLLELHAFPSPIGQDPFPIMLGESYYSGHLSILDTAPADFPESLSLASPSICPHGVQAPVHVPLGGTGWTWFTVLSVLVLVIVARRVGGLRES